MALENTTAQYTIAITKVGDGATQAQQELNALSQSAAVANSASANTTDGFVKLNTVSKNTSVSIKLLHTAAMAVGIQAFPQLTSGAMLAREALKQVGEATVSGAGKAGIYGAAIAGITAAIIAGAEAWGLYKDRAFEALTGKELTGQTHDFTDSLRAATKKLMDDGAITIQQYEHLLKLLRTGTADANQSIREAITDVKRGTASDRLSDVGLLQSNDNALAANARSRSILPDTYSRAEKEADYVRVLQQESEMLATINQLLKDGLITSEDADRMRLEAGTKRINQMTALNQVLTENEKIERSAAAAFSSGLATAIVDFASGAKSAKQAFSEFATSFLNDIAKMIIEMEIMKVLKTVLSFGGGGAAVSAQAFGGVTFAANGLAGVRDVSSPTYFPRFNVLAGEAGREMMTVLARPRFMEVGGLQAVVGNAGSSRLAITNADQLAGSGGGGGGKVHVHLTMDPGLRADIVKEAVDGSMITVTREVQRPGRLRDAMRKASS
jgi:hypothetical protein